MADGQLTAELAAIRQRAEACQDGFSSDPVTYIRSAGDVPRLLAAVNAVLALHSPRTGKVPGNSCSAHRNPLPGCGKPTLRPVPECDKCVQDHQRQVCPECRDEFGDPVLIDNCRVRSAILAGLTGKAPGDD